MSDPSSPIDAPLEWHALLGGERRGPLSRDGLRALLDSHPEGWAAPVWRLGMLDWRAASSVSALNATAPASQPPLVRNSAPLEGPAKVSAPRNTAGELRVLSYGELKAQLREVRIESSPPPVSVSPSLPSAESPSTNGSSTPEPSRVSTPSPALTSEWAAVGTSELSAIGTSELRALSLSDKPPSETSEWAAVGTSELRAVGTSELRALVLVEPSVVKTAYELPVLKPNELRESALPSMIVSDQTATELPSFNYRAESEPPVRTPDVRVPEAAPPTHQTATPTPHSLPAYSHKPSSPPSRLPLYVMAGLLVLSATAFGTVLTVRSLRAYEAQAKQEHSYRRAPPPPRAALPPPAPVIAARPVAAPPAAEALPVLDEIPIAAAREPALPRVRALARPPAPPETAARRAERHTREEGRGDSVAVRNVDSVRVSVASAPVRIGNHAEAKVVCTLARGTVRSVLTVLPSAQGRWFAVHCQDQSVGWVSEKDVAAEHKRTQ